MVSNEQLCKRIQGGESSLISDLILNNTGIVNRLSSYYMPAAERNRGADLEDLQQAARLGLFLAIDHWDESRGAFLTVAMLYMKREIRALLALHTRKQHIENVASVLSLYDPIKPGEDAELIEGIADESAPDPQEVAVIRDIRRNVRMAVSELKAEFKEAVERYYFHNEPLRNIDKKARDKALRALRRNKRLRDLVIDYQSPLYHWHSSFAYTHESCVETAVIKRERVLKRARGLFHTTPKAKQNRG